MAIDIVLWVWVGRKRERDRERKVMCDVDDRWWLLGDWAELER